MTTCAAKTVGSKVKNFHYIHKARYITYLHSQYINIVPNKEKREYFKQQDTHKKYHPP